MNDPFFYARISGGQSVVEGDQQATLGNRTKSSPDAGEVFAQWFWDNEKLTLTNDRYGLYPVYYFANNEQIGISSSIIKLLELGAKKDFDEEAFAVFLRLGWLVGDDTLFKSIRAVPPNSTLIWQNGKLEITSQGIIIAKQSKISRPQAIETYGEVFQRAVEKSLPTNDKFAVPLSGGRDSRHILLALQKANVKPDACLTIIHPPPRANDDAQIAAQICKTLDQKHYLIEQGTSRLKAECRKNMLTGFSVFEHAWFLALADFADGKWQTIYDGIAGDWLSAGWFLDITRLKLYQAGKFAELSDTILGKEGYLPALLTTENYRKFNREKAIHHLAVELEKHADAPNQIGSFFFWNRARRCLSLSSLRLIDEKIKIQMPYLATEVFDFLSTLPATMLLDDKFHTETISVIYPQFEQIPYENKNSPLIFDKQHFRKYSREILRLAFSGRKLKLINESFVYSRALRCLLDKKYAREIVNFAEPLILLMQMERLEQF